MNSKSEFKNLWNANLNKLLAVRAAAALLCLVAARSPAQTLTVLHSFSGPDGAAPWAGLAVGPDGTLYGTTFGGGTLGGGTIFKMNADGSDYTMLKTFSTNSNNEGCHPAAEVLLSGSTLYGTASLGGTGGGGTIFKLNTDGTGFQVIKSFSSAASADGFDPEGGLVLSGNWLYGTTCAGGVSSGGVVYKINTDGSSYTVLKSFMFYYGLPRSTLLLSGTTLYGTTSQGVVFGLNTDGGGFAGRFVCPSFGGLVLSGKTLYGTAVSPNPGDPATNGWIFKVDSNWNNYSELKKFTGSDGSRPMATLLLSGTTLLGTTAEGGRWKCGTVFSADMNGGNYTVLASFNFTNGAFPRGSLCLVGTTLFGETHYGGISNEGVVFSLSLKPPIVTMSPQSQTVELGSSAHLTATDNGSPAAISFWLFNGSVFDGTATNGILIFTNARFSQSGAYSAVITNSFGATTSAPAMLNVIPPVPRRPVPALDLFGETGGALNVEYADALGSPINWLPLDAVNLTAAPQLYLDASAPLPPQRFYRVWQRGTPTVPPSLNLPFLVPAITLTGNVSDHLRLDGINQFGPTDAWVNLATVTLTNTSQLYFDISAPHQPARLYRIVPVP